MTTMIVTERQGLTLRVASDLDSFQPCTPRHGNGCIRTVAFVVVDRNGLPVWMGCPGHIRQAGWFAHGE